MTTFIFSKTPESVINVETDLSSVLSENIQKVDTIRICPETENMVEASYTFNERHLYIKFLKGKNGITYGLSLLVNETPITVALYVSETPLFSYKKASPDSFMDLIGSIQAGNSAVSSVTFTLPTDIDLQNGYVLWDLIDGESNILASGNAFEYSIGSNGISNTASAKCLINVPSTLAPTLQNTRYQLRYCLRIKNQEFYQFETLRVDGNYTVPIGITDTVELQGTKANMQIVVPQAVDHVIMELYNENKLLASQDLSKYGERVSSGWKYAGIIDTTNMPVSLINYDVVFKYWNSSFSANVYQENAKLWIVNPSILSASRDVLEKINKARMTLYGAPDLIYTMPCIMTWLRRGADRFNAAYGIFTDFTFTNARGGVREYWLMWTELMAVESQYLAEGEKAFDFQGAAISLNVDRTQYLESIRGNLQNALDNEFKPFKQNLLIKGNTGGDGSVGLGIGGTGTPSGATAVGSAGAIGITITPATGWGRYYPGNFYTRWF